MIQTKIKYWSTKKQQMKLPFKNKQTETFNSLLSPDDRKIFMKALMLYFAFIIGVVLSIGGVLAALIYFAAQCFK